MSKVLSQAFTALFLALCWFSALVQASKFHPWMPWGILALALGIISVRLNSQTH